MTKEQLMQSDLHDVLKDALERAEHNLHCYSANWAYTISKTGFEHEWEAARREYHKVIRLLEFYCLEVEA